MPMPWTTESDSRLPAARMLCGFDIAPAAMDLASLVFRRPLACALSMALASMAAHAADVQWPPSWGLTSNYPRVQDDTEDDSAQVGLGREIVGVGVSKLSTLRKMFGGRGRVRARPGSTEHGESDYWLCYTVFSDGIKLRLWFGGSSGSAGETGEVTDYVAEMLPASATATERCPRLPARFAGLSFGHGVRLGAPAADVLAAMPGLKLEGDVWLTASSYLNRHWLVSRSWAIRVVGGRIVGIRAHELVSS
jgi:hypothetical protein